MSKHSYGPGRNRMQRLAQWPGGTGGLCLKYTDDKVEHEGSKRKHRMFPQWQGWEDAKGTVGDTRDRWTDGPCQEACEETIPSSRLGKEGPGGSLNLDVSIFEGPGIFECVEQQTSTCLAYLPEDSCVRCQNVSPLAVGRLKVLFSIWPASVGSVAFWYLFLCPASSKCPHSCRSIARAQKPQNVVKNYLWFSF